MLTRHGLGFVVIFLSFVARAGDMETYGSLEKLLTAHWKIEAKRQIPSFTTKESDSELAKQKSKAINDLVNASHGSLDAKQVLSLLRPTEDGKAPDWSQFKKLFNQPNDYFVESYLESADEYGNSSGVQVVSGEVGRIQKHEIRGVEIQGNIEKIEIYRLSPRANTYAGVLGGTKKTGSLVKPGLIVLEEREVKRMAMTPWVFREQLTKQFGTNYFRAEEETIDRIRRNLNVTGSLNALLTWRQMQGTTMSINEEATESWLIDQSAFRSRLMKDADFMEAMKGLEQKSSQRESLIFLSAFGAMGHSDIPLFILANTLQGTEEKKTKLGAKMVDQEIIAIHAFASYIQKQQGVNHKSTELKRESNAFVILSQLGRFSSEEIRKLCLGFYNELEISWELDGIAIRAIEKKFDLEYLKRAEEKALKLANNSLTILAKIGEMYYVNDHDEKAREVFRELYSRIQAGENYLGDYEQLILARSLTHYANSLSEQGNLREAFAIYQKVFQINKYYSVAYFHYARLQVRAGDLNAALQSVDECLKLEEMKKTELRNDGLVKEAKGLKERLLKVLNK